MCTNNFGGAEVLPVLGITGAAGIVRVADDAGARVVVDEVALKVTLQEVVQGCPHTQ